MAYNRLLAVMQNFPVQASGKERIHSTATADVHGSLYSVTRDDSVGDT